MDNNEYSNTEITEHTPLIYKYNMSQSTEIETTGMHEQKQNFNKRNNSHKNGTIMLWLKEISVPIYILVMLFAVSSWIDINGLWVEVPILVGKLPEGWNLPSYLVIIIQIANIGPLIYTIGHKIAPKTFSEVSTVYVIIGIGAISVLFIVHFWDSTSVILGTEHSVALFTLTGFLSLVDCTSSVVYLPYMQRLKSQYMSALYIGEGLSGLIPGFIGLAQGVGANPECVNSSNTQNYTIGTNTSEWYVYPVYPPPKFSVEAFFWILFGMLCLSGFSFTIVNYLRCCKTAHVATQSTHTVTKVVNNREDYERVNQATNVENIDTDGIDYVPYSSEDFLGVSTQLNEEGSEQHVVSTVGKKHHIWYLLLLTIWLCALTNGVLPSTQTYSCLPYGHLAYTLSVRLSTVVNPLACFMVLFLPTITVTGVSVLVGIASSLAVYLLYLAVASPTPPLQGHVIGVILVISSYVVMTALFSYAKVSIAIMLREAGGHHALLLCGIMTQIGSLCGALVIFIIINVFSLLQSMDPCTR